MKYLFMQGISIQSNNASHFCLSPSTDVSLQTTTTNSAINLQSFIQNHTKTKQRLLSSCYVYSLNINTSCCCFEWFVSKYSAVHSLWQFFSYWTIILDNYETLDLHSLQTFSPFYLATDDFSCLTLSIH